MAYVPMKTEELKKMVMMGKKRPMNFAYNPGPKDDDLMIIDRIKAPEALGRTAKKEGKGTKVAAGTFELEGKKFSIKVPKELPGLAKKLRKYLKKLDFSFSIVVLDPSGAVLEADLSDEDEKAQDSAPAQAAPAEDTSPPAQEAQEVAPDPEAQPTPEPSPQDAEADAKRAELTERLRALQGPVADLGKSGAALGKAAGAVVALLKQGQLDTAGATLAKIEAGVAKAQTAAAESNDAADAKEGNDAKALLARAGALRQGVDALQEDQAVPVKKQLAEGLAALKAKDWSTADAKLAEAEASLKAAQNTPAAAQQEKAEEAQDAAEDANAPEQEASDTNAKSRQKWEAMSGQIQTSVDAAMQAKRGDLDGINRAFNYAKSQAEAGAYDSAIAAATNTVKLLKAAANAPQGDARAAEAADSTPENVIAYRASRITWGKTRTGMQAELTKLKMAIDAQTSGVEGLEEIAQNTSVLFDYVEEIDASLEATLDALLQSPEGAARDKLKDEAIKIIANYRTTLDSDFFKSVDDNGFTKTTIRSSALTALAGVETALAA